MRVEEDIADEGMMDEDMMDALSGPMQKYFNPKYSEEFMAELPERVRQRAQVLLQYHEEFMQLEKDMEQKECELRRKYDALYAPILARRKEIISGADPTEEEVQKGFPAEHAGQVNIVGADGEEKKGLEDFWLQVLQHHVVLKSMIEDHDEDVLRHLVDISTKVVDGGYGSFAVTFTFAPNPYLEEEQLTLTLHVKDDKTEIHRSPLTWKPGKNVTVHTVTKKQRAKRTGQVRTISREEPRPSFFSIFKESEDDDDDDDDDEADENDKEEEKEQLVSLMQVLHNSIVPCAVNYYTGEAPDGSSDVEDDEEDEEEEDEEESEDDLPPAPIRGGRGGRGGRGNGGGGGAGRGGRGGRS